MNDKKTEVLTLRLAASTKKTLQQVAEEKEWTISKLAEKILTTWANSQKNDNGDIQFIIGHNETINIGR